MRTPQEIISSLEIIKVHGHANFGPRTPRSVVNEAVLKVACGYSNGSTALAIIKEHGLCYTALHRDVDLTDKGRKYLWAVYGKGVP